MKIECDRCGRCFAEDPNHVGYPAVHHCIQDAPSDEEIIEVLVALMYEDCSNIIGSSKPTTLLASSDAEITAVKLLERLGKVENVREDDKSIRADWVKEEAENES